MMGRSGSRVVSGVRASQSLLPKGMGYPPRWGAVGTHDTRPAEGLGQVSRVSLTMRTMGTRRAATAAVIRKPGPRDE